MTESQRHHAIIELLQQKRYMTVAGLIQAFDISPATARRDINKLNESGKLRKVRNGAEATTMAKSQWSPMDSEQSVNFDEKSRIAIAAAKLCQPGQSIVINCGSTACLLGQHLCGMGVQVITNYFPLASYLIEHQHERVLVIGGQYHRDQSIMLGAQDELSGIYTGDWMFTSGKGLTEDGLYKIDMLRAMAEQKMLANVGKLVALVDSSKIGQRGGVLFSKAEQMDYIITGKNADPKVLDALRAKGCEIILV